MIAIIYVRKSTASEGKSKSRDEQLELNLEVAKAFGFGRVIVLNEAEGMKGEWWWKDPAGKNPGPYRPDLTRLVEQVTDGGSYAVIVYKQDRLVRDNGVADALNKLFRQYGVRFICRGRDCEIDTARGLYQVSVDSAAARQWRDQISEDVQRDHDYKARLGMFTRDPSCFGWRSAGRESQQAVPQWDEIDIANLIFKWFVDGPEGGAPLSLHQIALRCMDQGIMLAVGAKGHKIKDPKLVTFQHVERILRNCMFVGRWRHNGAEYECDRLLVSREGEPARTAVPIELYESAQHKLKNRTRRRSKAGCSGRLLSGLVVCGACGQTMHTNIKTYKDGSKLERFFCPHRVGRRKTCTGPSYASLAVQELDEWVNKYMAPVLAHEIEVMRIEREASAETNELALVERRIEELRVDEAEKLAALVSAMDTEQLAAVAAHFRSERQRLEARAIEIREHLVDKSHGDVAEKLSSASNAVLREALRRAVRWIALTDKGVTVLTKQCGYMGAAYEGPPANSYRTRQTRRRLLPAVGAAASRLCREWICDEEVFAQGLGERAA